MAYELHQGTKRTITLSVFKADGTSGIVEGSPVWVLSPAELGALVVAEDGFSAELTWAGIGTGIVTATADGDLGEAIFPVVVSEEINFIAPLGAVAGSFTVSEEVVV